MSHDLRAKKFYSKMALIAVLLFSPLQAASIVHRFDFEDETGNDSVGDLEGVLVGDPTFLTEAPSGNRAIILEGDQYVRIDDEMDFGAEFSIFMWVQPDSSALGIQNLIANAQGGWDTDGFKLYYNTWSDPATADGAFILETGDGVDIGLAGEAVRSDSDTILDDRWYHAGTTVDVENGEALLYVDGELLFTSGGLNIDMKTDSPFEIGNMISDWDLHGLMDDVQIYEGILTEEEVTLLFNEPGSAIGLPSPLTGDYNGSGNLDAGDLDLQAGVMTGQPGGPEYDLNDDDVVDYADRLIWVNELKKTWIGDANLNGEFNSSDMVQVFAQGKYEKQETAGWEDGDWNGDTFFGSSDMVAAFVAGGYEKGMKEGGPIPAVSAVPEPTSVLLLMTGFMGVAFCRRRLRS